ncbi:DUF6037 family protein [Cohnella nanjingensis]|uniref:Uncharacterized protein n=1 Tax=Cohnella nanjingensis TaxID=1387779 RepID=A0A7X0RML2_9BACL|nr:DUF6037 family protein [Cohnella nanjingensis]MBB6670063.1 hypothetical protein [Cohnella nanjingensis]
MKLDGIIPLYNNMRLLNLDRYRFGFIYNNVSFDVFFFLDESPYKLMFGVKAENFYFEKDVKKGFVIDPTLEREKYSELCRILGLQYDPINKFKPIYFFLEFNKNITQKVIKKNIPRPHELAVYRKDVEESDKIFFMGWLDNKANDNKVTPKNLEKTRLLLGRDAYFRCKAKNVSSRWTDDIKKAQEVILDF